MKYISTKQTSERYSRLQKIFVLIFILGFIYIPQLGNQGVHQQSQTESNEITDTTTITSSASKFWWNGSFQYRRGINLINPFGKNVSNTVASVIFNYTEFVDAGQMNESLKDIRIVEDEQIRPYLVKKDYPNVTLAIVYFECNLYVNDNSSERIYMYYGNNTVEHDPEYYNKNNRFGNHWWTLDETYADSIHTVDGTTSGTISFTSGINRNGTYTASAGYVRMVGFNIGTTVSVMGWIRGGASGQMPFSFSRDGGVSLDLYYSGAYLYNNIGDGNGNPFRNPITSAQVAFPTDNRWYHIVWENIDYGNGTQVARLWFNGTLVGTALYRNPLATSKEFRLSGWSPPQTGYLWNGYHDDMRIFEYPLKQEEIKAIMNATLFKSSLGPEEVFSAYIDIKVMDVDGRVVPNAVVSLINATDFENPIVVETKMTGVNGIARFEAMDVGVYNITINYTTAVKTYTAYNSTELNFDTGNSNMYNFSNYINNVEILIDMWTIDFYVEDVDGNPMDLGYILVYEDPGNTTLWDNITLQSMTGTATFRGPVKSDYYYHVVYKNYDYYQPHKVVDYGTITRVNLTQYVNMTVSEKNSLPSGSNYLVQNTTYARFSNDTYRANIRLVNATIKMTNMEDLSSIDVYYIDINGSDHRISESSKSYPDVGPSQDLITYDFFENGIDAYGLKVVILGTNSSICDGHINISLSQTTIVNSTANLARANIHVVDGEGIVGAIVRLWDGFVGTGQSIVNLTTSSGELFGLRGYAYGTINKIPFWFTPGQMYNISLRFGTFEGIQFIVNETNPDQPANESAIPTDYFNFTLTNEMTIMLTLQNTANYRTELSQFIGTQLVTWGEQITYQVNFSTTTNNGTTWTAVTNPEFIDFSVYLWGIQPQLLYKNSMTHISNGIYQISLNSSLFSAEYTSKNYIVKVEAKVIGFPDPYPLTDLVVIQARPTQLSLHNYTDPTTQIPDFTVSQYYNESINLTLSFNYAGQRLVGGLLNYSWTYGSGELIGEDPLNPGYYTFTINTGDSPNIGKYSLDVTIQKENYTIGVKTLYLNILSRPTTLSESSQNKAATSDIIRISLELNKLDTHKFYFTYKEHLGSQPTIIDPTVAIYSWEYITNGTGGTGTLQLMQNGTFELDFGTSTKPVGSYILLVTIGKANYDQRQSIIFLTIKNRTTNAALESDFAGQTTIEKVKGNIFNFRIVLKDAATNQAIENAKVSLNLPSLGRTIEFEYKGDGVYEASDSFEDVQAFYRDAQISGTLIIEIEHYDTVVRDVSIVVKMEEISEGIPFFYVLLGVVGLVLVVGTLVGNKVYQNSKIPPLVRIMMALRKIINKNGPVDRSNLVDSYQEEIENDLEKELQAIGVKLNKPERKEEVA